MPATENRLISVTKTGFSATFIFDGDGNRIKSTVAGVTTTFIGNWFEWSGSAGTKIRYYDAGGRIAMRVGTGTATSTLTYLLGDHLNSTSFTFKADTYATITQLYKPWGESRNNSGTLPTKYTYTGQYSHTADFGLMFYNARWYDPALGRFAQADTLLPGAGNPMAFDRYSYTLNNPLRYTDPSGHVCYDPGTGAASPGNCGGDSTPDNARAHSDYCNQMPEECPGYQPSERTGGNGWYCKHHDCVGGNVVDGNDDSESSPGPINPVSDPKETETSTLPSPGETPWYIDLLAWQYTPVITSSINVLATDIAFLALALSPTPAAPAAIAVFIGAFVIGRVASVVSLASTGYQYQNNLYGTTRNDVIISGVTTGLGVIPKPDMAVVNHISFLYTLGRTVGVIESP